MAKNWQRIISIMPSDGTEVWIRSQVLDNYPVKAVYYLTSQKFICSVSDLEIPAYLVTNWAPI